MSSIPGLGSTGTDPLEIGQAIKKEKRRKENPRHGIRIMVTWILKKSRRHNGYNVAIIATEMRVSLTVKNLHNSKRCMAHLNSFFLLFFKIIYAVHDTLVEKVMVSLVVNC